MLITPESLPLPFPQSYWVIPGKLLAGRYPGSQDSQEMCDKLTGLLEVGIRRIVNLQEADERVYAGHPFAPYESEWQRPGSQRHLKFPWSVCPSAT